MRFPQRIITQALPISYIKYTSPFVILNAFEAIAKER